MKMNKRLVLVQYDSWSTVDCGVVGTLTHLQTSNGTQLRIGDVVSVKSPSGRFFEDVVRYSNLHNCAIIEGWANRTAHDLEKFYKDYTIVKIHNHFDENVKETKGYKNKGWKQIERNESKQNESDIKPYFVDLLIMKIKSAKSKADLQNVLDDATSELENT